MDCNREEGERGRPPSSKDEAPGRHGRKPNARTMECPLASVLSQFAFLRPVYNPRGREDNPWPKQWRPRQPSTGKGEEFSFLWQYLLKEMAVKTWPRACGSKNA